LKNGNRVLISGASVAGPALAFWLSRYGFETTVVERAPAVRPGGYAVDFRGAAMGVLERMGILGKIREYETRTGEITMVDKRNRRVARMPDGFTSGELEIMRGDLANVLYEATRNDAEYIFDDSITSITGDGDGVEATFGHNAPRRFDVIAGADGLHSNVRSLAFGEERRFIRDLGYYIAIFTTPNFLKLKGQRRVLHGARKEDRRFQRETEHGSQSVFLFRFAAD
jgi:2-polyprenyl-6-methoxyphenol hydroxylase-like FAD-dependent oxidoreductase